MKTIIAGSRNLGYAEVCLAMDACGWVPSLVISGTARGVDCAGERWAAERNIPVRRMPAEWGRYGRRAGAVRNAAMAAEADALVAVWDESSPGTRNMIAEGKKAGLQYFVWTKNGVRGGLKLQHHRLRPDDWTQHPE